MQIESGTGNGKSVAVDTDNMILTNTTSLPRASRISAARGLCFSWAHSYNYAAGDTILLVANTSTTKYLFIEKVDIASDTATNFQIHCPAYPTLAGTLITGVNDNRASGNVAEALAYGDETGNTQANVISRGRMAANNLYTLNIDGRVVLGYRNSIAVDLTTVGTMATCTIVGYYQDINTYEV